VGVERKRYKEALPVRIEDSVVAAKAGELAKIIQDRAALLEEKREANANYREKISFFNELLDELATSVQKHTELRQVQCVERLIVETNQIEVVREDTGEVVRTRTADVSDRQEALFPGEPKKKGPGRPKKAKADPETTADA
jgi:hypothetical protein